MDAQNSWRPWPTRVHWASSRRSHSRRRAGLAHEIAKTRDLTDKPFGMGLIDDIPTVAELVRRIVDEAEGLITGRLNAMIRHSADAATSA